MGKKPKMYCKPKQGSATKLADFKKNAGGGKVKGVITGPKSSIGDQATHPSVAQGMETGGNKKE